MPFFRFRPAAAALAVAGIGAMPATAAAQVPEPAAATAYRLAAGDEISVTFPNNPELNQAGPIGPDGRFSIPDIDSLRLADRTADEASRDISTALRTAGIVANARPSVQVRQYGASIFVGGEVRTPGAVKMTGPVDAMQAIILAGGLLDTARSNRVLVIRPSTDPAIPPQTQVVDIRDYLKHGRPLAHVPLQSRDVVFVPRSSIAEANLWIDQHINKLLPFTRSLNYNLGQTNFRSDR